MLFFVYFYMFSLVRVYGLLLFGFCDDIIIFEVEGSFFDSEDGEVFGMMVCE